MLNEEEMTEKDLIMEEYEKRPVFLTRKQLKERGELSDDNE